MRIGPGMVLTRRKEQKNRLEGVILPDTMDIATRLFDQFVYKVAGERGLNPEEGEDQMESVADMLVLNLEHSVYYVTSMNPHCKMCFIAGMYNTPTLTADKITTQIDEVSRALARKGFLKRWEVSDYAGCNQGYANEWYDIPATEYIPAEVLAKHGLDGDCKVAYKNYVDGQPVFGFDDPPHVLKRIGNAMRNRPLQWSDGYPMTMQVLGDVFTASCLSENEFAYQRERGLSPSLFDVKKVDRSMRMNVAPIAKVLSNKMVRTIDHVCNNPRVHFPNIPFPQRAQVLAPARMLCKIFNRWFDLGNSKDPEKRGKGNDKPVWVTTNNAVEIADEFLSTVTYLEKWIAALTVNGKFSKENFLPEEIFDSVKRCCYGFASMIYYWVIGKGRMLLLKCINQDVCEHHFGHVRTCSGYTNMPNQPQTNACGKTSGCNRIIAASESANVTYDFKNMELA
jgi:hypothetical protein